MKKISIEELENRMRPGQFSEKGFLGPSERLMDVLETDEKRLKELGVTYEELADALQRIIEEGDRKRGQNVKVNDKFVVKIEAYTGFQMCPFSPDPHHFQCMAAGGVRFGSLDWMILNIASGQVMHGPGIIVQPIRAHHFFEGFQSPYRVDPSELARLLELGT